MKVARKNYTIVFDDETGNITSFCGITGYDYIGKEVPLLRFRLLKENGEALVVESGKLSKKSERSGKVRLEYEMDKISAVAEFDCTDETFVKARVSFFNHTEYLTESVRFPGIVIKNRLGVDNFKLFWPAMEGAEIDNIEFRNELMSAVDDKVYPPKGWAGIYPGACSMQFMAYYNGMHGMYFASHDPQMNFKMIEWKAEEEGIALIQQLYPGTVEKEYSYSYDVVLGAIGGSWYDAAEIYRSWLQGSGAIKAPKIKENANLPKWLTDPLVVVTFPVRGTCDTGDMSPNCYYPYTNCLPYVEKYKEIFHTRVMALMMHWEGSAPWAPPYVWPPYGDKENFLHFVNELHKADDVIGLYCSGIGWTQLDKNNGIYNMEEQFDKLKLADSVEVGPDNTLQYTTICGHIRDGYDLCPACEATKEIAVEEARKISKDCEVDYLQYFDQNIGGNTYPCYSKKHPHPPLPGKWMHEEMLDIAAKMQEVFNKAYPDRKTVLGGEAAACEPILGALYFNDSRYNINLVYGIPVPAYKYVVGEYVLNFMGNHTAATRLLNTKLYPDNLFYRTAYSFAQGDVLTLMLKDGGKVNWEWNDPWDDENEPDQAEYLRYAKLLNDWRDGILYHALRFGKMVKPKSIKCAKYLEKLDRTTLVRCFDEILSTRIQTEEGKDYQIFVNYRNHTSDFTVTEPIKCLLHRKPDGSDFEKVEASCAEWSIPAHSVLVAEILR